MTTEFLERFPGTVELTISAMIFAIGRRHPAGLPGRPQARHLDRLGVGDRLADRRRHPRLLPGLPAPLDFAVNLGWLPGSGRQDVRIDATRITNFYVLDGLLTREWDAAWDALLHLVLPAIALGTIPLAIIVRITRASVLDVVNEDYVRTANAKGLASDRAAPAHPPQRHAAGVDHDRPVDRPAAVRRRPHRDGFRVRRGGLGICRRDRQRGTTPCCRASS